ncbi:MAG TPA: TA system VapC family ribonuclease toxin [Solirubrobacteraceae bacterium]|nr:TA system VapC family ribonuclease toxin [Solirubrobacteraceae bacterium]
MSVALDANILLYAANADDERNERAQQALFELAAGPEVVYLFWPVVMAFLRIATRASIFPHPLSPADALARVDSLLNRDHVFSPGEDDRFWDAFNELATEQRARGDLLSDVHIVALMRRHGVRTIITADRDFRRFDGIEARNPFG